VTAPLFRLGLETGIEAAIGAGSLSKAQYQDDPIWCKTTTLISSFAGYTGLSADGHSIDAQMRQFMAASARQAFC
jgi:hypothetical protein